MADKGMDESLKGTPVAELAAGAVTAPAAAMVAPAPCVQLYDPCTREPLPTMKALETRIREIKARAAAVPVGLYGLKNTTTNYDFLTTVFVDPAISLEDMVSFKLSEGRASAGSDIYEVLSRLFVFFGGIPGIGPLATGTFKFMDRIEGGGKVYDDTKTALESMKCIASKGSGISDITLVRAGPGGKVKKEDDAYCEESCEVLEEKADVKTYVMSVKWYSKEKGAEHYDLEKLHALATSQIKAEGQPVGIIVFLKSKKDFQIAHNRSFRQYVRNLGNTFFGWYEDVKPFLEEKRKSIFELAGIKGIRPREALLESQYFVKGAKPALSLQLHQDIIVTGLCDKLGTTGDNLYLVGVLPRGGKTFIAGGIIREVLKRSNVPHLNIFWLTAAPNETLSQVKDDLIDKFQDFDDFEFIHAREDSMDDLERQRKASKKPHTVVFCSSQLLIAAQKKGGKKREFLESLLTGKDRLGLVFFDEAHKTGTGDETKSKVTQIIDTYSDIGLPFVFLTATYYNILFDYKVQKENTFIWDYTDVLATRALATESEQENALQNLKNRFGSDLVNRVGGKRLLNKESWNTMAKDYIKFPDMYFMSLDFTQEALARFEAQDEYRPDAGFSLTTIFAIQPGKTVKDVKTPDNKIRSDAYKIFENLDNPRNMIAVLTPSGEFELPGESGRPLAKEAGSALEPSLLGRINKASQDSESRFRLDERPTLLMFMPVGGSGTNIFYLLSAWASLLMNHSWWRERYEVACVVSDETISPDDMAAIAGLESVSATNIHLINKKPKSALLTLERTLHCEKGKGLVILAGEKLSMGISLPCTDVVFLLNDKKSPDDIIQKMYRALTPSPGKKSAFVVDLNPVRTLAAIYGYTRASHEGAQTKSNILDIIYDNYSWDADVFEHHMAKGPGSKPLTFQDHLRKLFEQAERDDEYKVHEDIGGFEKKLADNIRRGIDPEFIGKLRGKFSVEKLQASLGHIGLSMGSTVELDKKGKLVIRAKVPKLPKEGEEPSMGDVEIVIENFIETLADFVKYLSITSSKPTMAEAIVEYESNKTDGEGTSLQSNVLKLVKARTPIKGVDDDALLSKILITAVKDFAAQSSSMVYSQMKGKVDEKSTRKNAVLKIIHRHLTPRKKQKAEKGEVFTPVELIEAMLSHLPDSVWKNPDLKWLDPANGIGNFPIVAFYKLDEGLKSWESNEMKRRTHIINKMLYMLEIQSNNTRIARNLFEKMCDGCKPNILTTNSLEMTGAKLKAKGFPEQYDIIIGNPPFNAGGLLKGGGTLWPKFVRLAMNLVAPNGYITFVHPPGWRKFYDPEDRESQGKLLYDIRQKHWTIKYINVSDKPPKHFPVVDYYVIHAKDSEHPMEYDSLFMGVSSSGKMDITEYPFIPNMMNEDTFGILNKLFSMKGLEVDIVRNQSFQPTEKDEGNSGVRHYHYTSRGGTPHYVNKEYSSVPEYIGKAKVVMTFSGGYEKGKLLALYADEPTGTTGSSMYMLAASKAQGENLVSFFNSDIITFLMKITQYSPSPNHKNEFKILNLLKVPESIEEYHLTEKEKALIAKIVNAKEQMSEGKEAPVVASGGAGGPPPGRRSPYPSRTRRNRRGRREGV